MVVDPWSVSFFDYDGATVFCFYSFCFEMETFILALAVCWLAEMCWTGGFLVTKKKYLWSQVF